MVISSLIKELVEHVNKDNIPKKIDLVLDGGAFNGAFQLGALLYLKELERNKMIEINKISGVSVGSMLGVAFILDKLDLATQYCHEVLDCYRNYSSLKNMSMIINKFFINHVDRDDFIKLNGKMYITYYNNRSKSQIIKHTYKNNKDVEDSVNKSSFIPYFMGTTSYKNKYIDGAFPYIFKSCRSKSKKVLFMCLTSYSKLPLALNIKNDNSLHGRIIDGIFDLDKFFNKNIRTDMCSYVDDWNVIDFSIFRLREFFFVILLFLIDFGHYFQKKIPSFIVESNQYSRILQILKAFYIDIVSNILT